MTAEGDERRRGHQGRRDERVTSAIDFHRKWIGQRSRPAAARSAPRGTAEGRPENAVEILTANRVGTVARAVPPKDVFHLVLQPQFLLLEADFFELFGFREVVAGRETVELFVEVMMLGRQLAELLIALQQLTL